MSTEMNFSLVEYVGSNRNYHCGYCKGEHCVSHGMWSHQLTVQDYQDLIDRGWRRSGQYCYKPCMQETCCPSYTIKCDILNFKLNKSHKKVLKRINKFLQDGLCEKTKMDDGDTNGDHLTKDNQDDTGNFHVPKGQQLSNLENINVDNIAEKIKSGINNLKVQQGCSKITDIQQTPTKSTTAKQSHSESSFGSVSSNSTNPPRKKAKLLRIERKLQKLSNQGISIMPPKPIKNIEKTLKDYFDEEPKEGAHRLKVKTIPSEMGATNECFGLYKKYQMSIHNDTPEKLTLRRFNRFLTNSPIKIKLLSVDSDEFVSDLWVTFKLYKKYQTIIHNDPPDSIEDFQTFLTESPLKLEESETAPPMGYGSFHQQYWLDDKLIAVAVIDILPSCISSVYFFYDPDYSFLSLGTYGSLREIYFTQQLSDHYPELCNYYMGYYIHSCAKMKYKGKLNPSYLLCPEVYTWHHLSETLLKKLDETKYLRLNSDLNAIDSNDITESDLPNVFIYFKAGFLPYKEFVRITGSSRNKTQLLEYGKLVGENCLKRMVIVLKC